MDYYGHNRYMCDVLEELRKQIKPLTLYSSQYNIIHSLIEECQTMGNRMEASLSDLNDLQSLHDEIKERKARLKEIKAEVKAAKHTPE